MKLQVLKFFLSVLSVISLINCNAQTHNEVSDILYYKLISDIIHRDTLIPEWRNKIIESKIKNGILTKEDSAKYCRTIKNHRLLLFYKRTDSDAKAAMVKDLNESHCLEKLLSTEEVSRAIEILPNEDKPHNTSAIPEEIELISELPKWQDYHKFSSSVLINSDYFLIYHYMSLGRFGYKYSAVLFSLTGNSYKIGQEIILRQIIP